MGSPQDTELVKKKRLKNLEKPASMPKDEIPLVNPDGLLGNA